MNDPCRYANHDLASLLRAARTGDRLAEDRFMAELLRQVGGKLFAVAFRRLNDKDLANMVMAETLVRTWRALVGDRTDVWKNIQAFTFGVFFRCLSDVQRRHRAHHDPLVPLDVDNPKHTPESKERSPETQASDGEVAALVGEALATVPEPRRVVVWLHAGEGWTFKQIAAYLGIREDAAKMRYKRGMKELRAWMGRKGLEG